jgi:hypothetical protein
MVKMMDAQLATRIMERIAIGDIVRVEVGENEWSNEKVIEKTAYSLTVRGKYNKLFLSVQCTEAYQKEMQMRMPTAAIEPPVARGRGLHRLIARHRSEPHPSLHSALLPPPGPRQNRLHSLPLPRLTWLGLMPTRRLWRGSVTPWTRPCTRFGRIW